MGFNTPGDPSADLVAYIRKLESRISQLENQPFRIPVLDEDPGTEEIVNVWLLADGRLRARHRNPTDTAWVTREWITSAPGSGTSGSAPAPPTSAPQSRSGSWAATWSASYKGSGARRTDNAAYLYHGYVDGTNGRQRSLAGFDATTIAAALSGSTITRVQLTMQQLHTYYSSGKIGFGYHSQASMPSSWPGVVRSMVTILSVNKTQLKTFDLPLEFGTAIRDGVSRGISLEAPSDSRDYYGYAGGVGAGVTVPTLRIEYVK